MALSKKRQKELIRRAEDGDMAAQREMADYCMMRFSKRHNRFYLERALHFYELAANLGDLGAQLTLAMMHRHGEHVDRNSRLAARWYQSAANNGAIEAQLIVGEMYQYGLGVKRDLATAESWYLKAANSGDSEAQFRLGRLYRSGHIPKSSPSEAWNLLEAAAGQGHVEALTVIARMHMEGYGVPRDLGKAADFHREAAKLGGLESQCELGKMLLKGQGSEVNRGEAAECIIQSSHGGYPEASYLHGVMRIRVLVEPCDIALGVSWLHAAAEKGDLDAKTILGACYHNGVGVSFDKTEAFKHMAAAAKGGHLAAKILLGACYQNGSGIHLQNVDRLAILDLPGKEHVLAKDIIRGKRSQNQADFYPTKGGSSTWIALDDEDADTVSQYVMGFMLLAGLGSPKAGDMGSSKARDLGMEMVLQAADNDAGCSCLLRLADVYALGASRFRFEPSMVTGMYRRVAERGGMSAQLKLGNAHVTDQIVPRNYAEAAKWYHLAALQGAPEAQYYYGVMLCHGLGVSRSVDEGKEWIFTAAKDADARVMSIIANEKGLPGSFWVD